MKVIKKPEDRVLVNAKDIRSYQTKVFLIYQKTKPFTKSSFYNIIMIYSKVNLLKKKRFISTDDIVIELVL